MEMAGDGYLDEEVGLAVCIVRFPTNDILSRYPLLLKHS